MMISRWKIIFVFLSFFGIIDLVHALKCYNGCGLKSEMAPYCVTHASAYLAANDYSEGVPQACPADADQCSDVKIWVPSQYYSFTIRGCDSTASCEARNDMYNLAYVIPDLGMIQSTSCCSTDLCNVASVKKPPVGLFSLAFGVVTLFVAVKLVCFQH